MNWRAKKKKKKQRLISQIGFVDGDSKPLKTYINSLDIIMNILKIQIIHWIFYENTNKNT